jgi:hypothetical protein
MGPFRFSTQAHNRVSRFRGLPQIATASIGNCLDFGRPSRHTPSKKGGSLARICGDGEERPVAADGFDAYRRSQIMIGCGVAFPDAACWSCDGSRAARLSPRCSYRLSDCPTWATFSDSRFCSANSAQVDVEALIRDHGAGAYGEAPQRERDVIPSDAQLRRPLLGWRRE